MSEPQLTPHEWVVAHGMVIGMDHATIVNELGVPEETVTAIEDEIARKVDAGSHTDMLEWLRAHDQSQPLGVIAFHRSQSNVNRLPWGTWVRLRLTIDRTQDALRVLKDEDLSPAERIRLAIADLDEGSGALFNVALVERQLAEYELMLEEEHG